MDIVVFIVCYPHPAPFSHLNALPPQTINSSNYNIRCGDTKMAYEDDIIDKWEANWNPWFEKAESVLARNAEDCKDKSGLKKMACIAAKNHETVTARKLKLPPKGQR